MKKKRILAVAASNNAVFSHLYSGFLEVMYNQKEAGVWCDIESLYGFQDDEQLRTRAEEVLQRQQYDLIFTIGLSSSKIIRTIIRTRRLQTAQFFSGVLDPERQLSLRSRVYAGEGITGVYGTISDYTKPMDILARYVEFGHKRAVVLYRNIAMRHMGEEIQGMIDLLQKSQFRVVASLAIEGDDSLCELAELARQVDIVVMPRDSFLIDYIEPIRAICNTYGVTLYGSDFEVAKAGAAFGYGSEEDAVGKQAAHKIMPVLKGERSAGQIPQEMLTWKPRLMINKDGLRHQRVPLKIPLSEIRKDNDVVLYGE